MSQLVLSKIVALNKFETNFIKFVLIIICKHLEICPVTSKLRCYILRKGFSKTVCINALLFSCARRFFRTVWAELKFSLHHGNCLFRIPTPRNLGKNWVRPKAEFYKRRMLLYNVFSLVFLLNHVRFPYNRRRG